MRNPAVATTTMREWFQGMDLADAAAAGAGLLATTTIPGMLIQPAAGGTELNPTQKFMTVVVGVGAAVAAGAVGNAFGSRSLGRAALAGGIAGTVVQVLKEYTGLLGAAPASPRRRVLTSPSNPVPALGRYPTPSYEPEFNAVRLQ